MLVGALLLFFGYHHSSMMIPRGSSLEARQSGGRLPERLTGNGQRIGRGE